MEEKGNVVQTKVKSRAKMANTAFAHKFTTPCKLVCKCGIYHTFSFLLVYTFLHLICSEQICVNLIFRTVMRGPGTMLEILIYSGF